MNARKEEDPRTRIAEIKAVIIPIGAVAKITMSVKLKHSLRNCFVGASPNRAISGARSVARSLAKSSHQLVLLSMVVSGLSAWNRRQKVACKVTKIGEVNCWGYKPISL